MSVVNTAQKVGEKSAQKTGFTTRQRVLDTIARMPCGSSREVAVSAGVSEKTAERVLANARKNCVVEKFAGVYRLLIPGPRAPETDAASFFPSFAHDAFRHRALGKTAADVLAVIERESIGTARDLADASDHLTPDQARRALTKLRKADVVEKFGGVYRRLDKDLAQVAKEHGTLGTGKKQQDQHDHESEDFRTAVKNGALQPGFGKRKLHLVPLPGPEPNWDGLDATVKMAASFVRYAREKSRSNDEVAT